jgi:hypothetical protein
MVLALVALALNGLVAVPASAGPAVEPPIRVWLTGDTDALFFRTGDPVRVLFRSADDAHVVVLRADANGKVSVLFPTDPEDMNLVRGETTYEVLGRGQSRAFVVDETSGTGIVLAATTNRPIPVGRFARKDSAGGWDYGAIDAARNGRPGRDGLIEIAKVLAGDGHLDYDITAYVVGAQPPPIAQNNPPPLEGERAPLPGTYDVLPYQQPETQSYQSFYDQFAYSLGYAYPYMYAYPAYYDGYGSVYGRGSRRHTHAGFVPCQFFCYPGSPTALVDFAHVPAGGNTGTGLFIGRGDPAQYLAVPPPPQAHVPTYIPKPTPPAPSPRSKAQAGSGRRQHERWAPSMCALLVELPRPSP